MIAIVARRLIAVAVVALAAAAAAAPPPSIPEDGEVSFDGLHRVENSRFQYVWIRKETDVSVYKKLTVLGRPQTHRVDGRQHDQGS